jgi:phosphatidylglycerol:prolipoprotein diacylglycerol transferase
MLTGAIVWDTDGIIVDLGVISLKYYSLFFLFAFASGYFVLKSRFLKYHIDITLLEVLTVYVFLGTLIGARLGHCFFYDFEYYEDHPLEIILPFTLTPSFHFTGFQGLASHGGGIGIITSLVLYSKKYGLNLWFLLDEISLVVPLAGCFIRLGNLMNAEIIGIPSNLPWAFIFVKKDAVPRHPAQLYEAIACLIIFFLLYRSMRYKKKLDGYYFGLLLVLLFSFRFLIEILKENQSSFEHGMLLHMGQLLSIPFIVLGLVLMVIRSGNGHVYPLGKTALKL